MARARIYPILAVKLTVLRRTKCEAARRTVPDVTDAYPLSRFGAIVGHRLGGLIRALLPK